MMKTNQETQKIMLEIGVVQDDIAIEIGERVIKEGSKSTSDIITEYRTIEMKLQTCLKDIEKDFKTLRDKNKRSNR